MAEAFANGFQKSNELANMLPRVRLVSAEGHADDPATQSAFRIAQAMNQLLLLANEQAERKMEGQAGDQAGETTYEDERRKARAELHGATGTFAADVSARIRKRWI
jgi:hypothetical protein